MQAIGIPDPLMRSIHLQSRSITDEELETCSALPSIARDDQRGWLNVKGRSLDPYRETIDSSSN